MVKNNIKRIRKEIFKKTQEEMAEWLNIDPKTMRKYENDDDSSIPYKLLKKIADKTKLSIDYIMGLSTIRSSNPVVKDMMEYCGLSEEAIETLHGNCTVDYSGEDSFYYEQLYRAKINKLIYEYFIIGDPVMLADDTLLGKNSLLHSARFYLETRINKEYWTPENGRDMLEYVELSQEIEIRELHLSKEIIDLDEKLYTYLQNNGIEEISKLMDIEFTKRREECEQEIKKHRHERFGEPL